MQSGNNALIMDLHRILSTRFGLEELRTLCLYVGVDFDDLGGEGRPGKARELIKYLDNRGQLDQLVKAGQQFRSDVPWPVVPEVPVPVSYGSAFEGEVVRKADMRVEFGGKYARCFEYLSMAEMDEVEDGKITVVGPGFERIPDQGAMDMGIVIVVAGRKMQSDLEPVLEQQVHYFLNCASGIQHIGQRDIAWIRISKAAHEKGFDLNHFGEILYARFHSDFDTIVDKVQVTIYTDESQFTEWLEKARVAYVYRDQRPADH